MQKVQIKKISYNNNINNDDLNERFVNFIYTFKIRVIKT